MMDTITPKLDSTMNCDQSIRASLVSQSASTESCNSAKKKILFYRIHQLIAAIDQKLNEQVNQIIHHATFQQLEASWRGLAYLVRQANPDKQVKIKVINCSWKELSKDMLKANEFDQSILFQKVYSNEFGMPGGEPFGLLIGDYEIAHRIRKADGIDDLMVLQAMSQVGAAAFAPVILSASPTLFGLDSFAEIGSVTNLTEIFNQEEYKRWQRFRLSEDARFVGIVLPKLLMRRLYKLDSTIAPFPFEESIDMKYKHQSYLWGNAVYAYASVVMRSFEEFGWLADISGYSNQHYLNGGKVEGLVFESSIVDCEDGFFKPTTDVVFSSRQDKLLEELGFLPLTYCRQTKFAVFYGSHSLQIPKKYMKSVANQNARYSANLKHILCACRFAHYLKVIMRDEVGEFHYAKEIEQKLNRWLNQYSVNSNDTSSLMRVKYPLAEGRVRVTELPDKPGVFICVIHLRPHLHLDQINSTIELAAYFGVE